MFDVGQRVVCVYRGPWASGWTQKPVPPPVPIFEHTYEVLGTGACDCGCGVTWINISVQPDRRWTSECFRPVEERKTSIEVFNKLLAPKEAEKVYDPTRFMPSRIVTPS